MRFWRNRVSAAPRSMGSAERRHVFNEVFDLKPTRVIHTDGAYFGVRGHVRALKAATCRRTPQRAESLTTPSGNR